MTTRSTITVSSNYEVVGYNPESADLDRPRGEIIAEVFFLLATDDATGERRAYGAYPSFLSALMQIPSAPPSYLWSSIAPEYGSAAWIEYGESDQLADEKREEDDDWLN
jgi:hypothetical protein